MTSTIRIGPVIRSQVEIPGTWCFVQSYLQRNTMFPMTLSRRKSMLRPIKTMVACVAWDGLVPSLNLFEIE